MKGAFDIIFGGRMFAAGSPAIVAGNKETSEGASTGMAFQNGIGPLRVRKAHAW